MGINLRHNVLTTLVVVIMILLVKIAFHQYGINRIELNSLTGSIIAGGLFTISILLAGILTDYKECEKMPAELITSLARIIHDFKYDVVKTVFFVKLSTFSYF